MLKLTTKSEIDVRQPKPLLIHFSARSTKIESGLCSRIDYVCQPWTRFERPRMLPINKKATGATTA